MNTLELTCRPRKIAKFGWGIGLTIAAVAIGLWTVDQFDFPTGDTRDTAVTAVAQAAVPERPLADEPMRVGVESAASPLVDETELSEDGLADHDIHDNAEPIRPSLSQPEEIQLASLVRPQIHEHPLAPIVHAARVALGRLESVKDYSATLVARERVGKELNPTARMPIKVRHEPFSVYISYLEPAKAKGQEVIYVEGRNNGKLWAHTTGLKHRLIGTLSLNPTGDVAMSGNRYPVTQVGIKNLVSRIIEIAQREMAYGDCEVSLLPGIEINGRECAGVQLIHPERRSDFLYHRARVYIDPQWSVPVRFESYDWPAAPGEEPPLLEEYTYHDLKLNQDFTDEDFDPENPRYAFGRGR